jgi:enoyl-CoA hydratase/carnithine racemase
MSVLLVEDRGPVRVLTMNRPEKRNALDSDLTKALLENLNQVDRAEGVGCIVLTGAGQGFCAGADLTEFKGLQDPRAADERAELTMQLHLAFAKSSKPIVTAINGAVMAASAKLGYPEAKHGIVAAIVMANLVRQVGRKAAFELVALGEPIGAGRALELGVVNRVVADAELMPHAIAYAEKLAAVSPIAMRETKRLFHEVADLPLAAALERGRDTNRRMRNFQKLAK